MAENSNGGRTSMVEDWNSVIIKEFRENGGKVGGQFHGAPLLLLTTTGAKTGQRRTNPMMYLAHGDRMIVFASKAGAPTNPDWYHNLTANPTVTVEVGDETFDATAAELTGAERDEIFTEQASRYPGFAEYQEKTSRLIPVIALTRAKH
jgi:deazaflavin-dependent oxidoreductase (nitroreductase family)